MAPQKAAVKQIKARPNQNLQIVPASTGFTGLPPIGLVFEAKREAPALPVVVKKEDPWERTANPGEFRNRVTGETKTNRLLAAVEGAAPMNSTIPGDGPQRWIQRNKSA